MARKFERILTIMFENQYRRYAMQDPFLQKLARAGADMQNFFGCFHLSQTNYLASLAGEVCGVTSDVPPAKPLPQQTLVDLLEDKGCSWKAYMEAYPGEPWNKAWMDPGYQKKLQPMDQFPPLGNTQQLGRYYRKHNAFASYHTIQAQESRWKKIVGDQQFWKDIANKEWPDYGWFTPDIWNDGHYLYGTHIDTNPRINLIAQLSSWLEFVFFPENSGKKVQSGYDSSAMQIGLNLDIDALISDHANAWKNSNVPAGTLIVITFDEADFNAVGYDTNYDGPNQIYTVLLGDMIEPGTVIDTPLNHYSLIKTIQKNFDLDSLNKNDRDANWVRSLWKQAFTWSESTNTGINTATQLASAVMDRRLYVVTDDASQELSLTLYDIDGWSQPSSLGVKCDGAVALACLEKQLFLVMTGADGALACMTFDQQSESWTKPTALGVNSAGELALSSYFDWQDQRNKLMLCWASEKGFINYSILANGNWSESAQVGQLTDGCLTLAQHGTSLYLVYKERNTQQMRLSTFNLAPFNAFSAMTFDESAEAPQNNTSLHKWSPFDMPVGHFAMKSAALQEDYVSLGRLAMAAIEGEMQLVHRGGFEDTPQLAAECFGLTGIYTAETAQSNGWGTIKQAGWVHGEKLDRNAEMDPDSPIALCSDGIALFLCWQRAGSKEVYFAEGKYR